MERQPLWTRNFTILTLGTVVSMLGNAISGFALSLLILDYTGSTLLYAIFMVVYNLPKIIMPSIAGPYLDRFSRTKAIWTLDYLSAALYLVIFFLLRGGLFNYALLLGLCIVIGTIDSVYLVAYDSLYPMLISEGNYAKAYSISSMIYPLSALMVPIASWCYEHVGLMPLFLFNAATFAIAATFETQIRVKETQVSTTKEPYSLSRYKDDFKQGIAYLKQEKGLLVITAYFVVSMMVGNGSGTLILPYFKSQESLGVMTYTWVMGCSVLGRLVGGAVHYKFRYPTARKFAIALFVYIVSALIDASYLFAPVMLMMLLQFVSGLICVTSYNIRISSTQNYVPNEMRGRFNGTFQMLTTAGAILGQLLAGALGDVLPIRPVIVCLNAFSIVAAVLIMYRGRRHVAPIYNVAI